MIFGEDPDREPERPSLRKRRVLAFGDDGTESAPKPVRHRKPSTITIAAFLDGWDRIVMQKPEYGMYEVMNKPAFSKYLNETFFSDGQFSVEDVVAMVRQFMDDLEHGNISIKSRLPVWIMFTKNWRRYGLQATSKSDKVTSLLERLQTDEWKF